jgi:ABC-type transport system involved in multi-copper enzyme maturation permease subunit
MNLYQSSLPIGRESFGQLVQSEWTKLRSVRAWKITILLALVLTVAIAVVTGEGSHSSFNGVVGHASVPTGPGGEPVTDTFFFVQQPLTGDGTITARVTSLVGVAAPGAFSCPGQAGSPAPGQPIPLNCSTVPAPGTTVPWAKAGLIVKASDAVGSAYAAVMVTHSHGVRMQWNYVNDVGGTPGAVSATSPRWLRLTRSGDTLTGYDATDGHNWSEIDSVTLPTLATTVEVGLFVASPQVNVVHFHTGTTFPSLAKANFDHVTLDHAGAGGTWHGHTFGASGNVSYPSVGGYYRHTNGAFTVAGSGDIAPAAISGPAGLGEPPEITLVGGFLGLLVLIVLGTVFITGEYRRGLIRTTLAASPRRGRVLVAKAVVLGAVSFVVGVVAATVSVTVGGSLLRSNGNFIYPVSTLTEVRMIVGVGAVLAAGAVLALALGTILRHGAGVVVGLLALFVLPEFLSAAAVLPAGPGEWLLRLTPAAGFAVEQSLQVFPQVTAPYWPQFGYYPLPQWGGFLVLCAYAAAALALANHLLARRDV